MGEDWLTMVLDLFKLMPLMLRAELPEVFKLFPPKLRLKPP
jgi:hypothetical protein